MAIVSEDVRYRVDDTVMHGRVFHDDARAGQRPGVLVFPEGFGISEHTYGEARRIAQWGYVAMACDQYGDGYFNNGPNPQLVAHRDRLLTRLHAVGEAARRQLFSHRYVDPQRIAACGYCLGATVAMEMSLLGSPILAACGFHPSFDGLSVDRAKDAVCPIELFIGAEDYSASPARRAEFESAFKGSGATWRMTVYGGVKHSFTNPNIEGMGELCAYDRAAHDHSMAEMAALLQRRFALEGNGRT